IQRCPAWAQGRLWWWHDEQSLAMYRMREEDPVRGDRSVLAALRGGLAIVPRSAQRVEIPQPECEFRRRAGRRHQRQDHPILVKGVAQPDLFGAAAGHHDETVLALEDE